MEHLASKFRCRIARKVFFYVKEDFKVKKDGYIIIEVGYSKSSVAKLTELTEINLISELCLSSTET